MSALFLVRATVADNSLRDAFDRWYAKEHLPDALRLFGARRAWRGWSSEDPRVHYACYEFESLAGAKAILGSEGLKNLIAEFDRAWGDRVARSRDFIEIVQQLPG